MNARQQAALAPLDVSIDPVDSVPVKLPAQDA